MNGDAEDDQDTSPVGERGPDARGPRTVITRVTAAVMCLGGLIALLKGGSVLYSTLAASPSQLAVAILLCLAVLLMGGFLGTRKSRWLDRDLLLADPAARGLLLGRKDEVEVLAQLCEESSVVVLSGEAGSGKTALVHDGLMPGLSKGGGRLLPLVLATYGDDWEAGPMAVLRQALQKVQPRAAVRHIGFAGADSAEPSLAALCEALAPAEVLLVFDNFEQYLLANVDRFMPHKQPWIAPAALTAGNGFWREVAGLVGAGRVKCLFVVRSEHADLLAASVVPALCRADRRNVLQIEGLQESDLAALIDAVVEPPGGQRAVADPQYGWQRLAEVLCLQMHRRGGLPADLLFALRVVSTLGAPTRYAYNAAGQLGGIAASYLRKRLRRAKMRSGLTEQQVLRALEALVGPRDRGSAARRPPGRSTPQLAVAAFATPTPTSQQVASLDRALSVLANEVVKAQVDAALPGKSWSLYSDLLIAAITRRSVWQARLDSFALDYASSSTFLERRFLPLPLQVVLFVQRMGNRIRYGPARNFALLSLLLGLGPWLVAGVAMAAVGKQIEERGDANLFRSWRLPPDLVDRQDQLEALKLNVGVSQIDWLHDNLRRLDLSGANIGDDVLRYPPHLVALDLSYTPITSLSHLPRSLSTLGLVGVSGLRSLAGAPPKLRVLHATATGLSDFRGLPSSLEELDLGGAALSSLAQLPPLPRLKRLTLDHAAIATLRGMPPSVRSLTLRMDWQINKRFQLRDEALPPLTDLVLDGVPGVALGRLPPSLRTLELANLVPRLPSLAGLPPHLERLMLRGQVFAYEGAALPATVWSGLPTAGLRSLALIDQPDLPRPLPQGLERLVLRGEGGLDPAILQSLVGLRVLDLGSYVLKAPLRLPPSLRSLTLDGIDVRDLSQVPDWILDLAVRWAPHLTAISRLPPRLRSLQLVGCTSLRAVTGVPPSLLSLDLERTPIENLPRNLSNLLVLDVHATQLPEILDLPPRLAVLTVSPGLKTLRGLPPTVIDLRFIDPLPAQGQAPVSPAEHAQ